MRTSEIQVRPEPIFLILLLALSRCDLQRESQLAPEARRLNDRIARDIRQWAGRYLYRPVIDRTGLTGAYDFTLHWATDAGPN
jgi:uncharacterized protein (TIGR03435 family)